MRLCSRGKWISFMRWLLNLFYVLLLTMLSFLLQQQIARLQRCSQDEQCRKAVTTFIVLGQFQ